MLKSAHSILYTEYTVPNKRKSISLCSCVSDLLVFLKYLDMQEISEVLPGQQCLWWHSQVK